MFKLGSKRDETGNKWLFADEFKAVDPANKDLTYWNWDPSKVKNDTEPYPCGLKAQWRREWCQ